MSLWKPTKYGPERRELYWLNLCISSHDLMCGCDSPGSHLMLLLAKKSGYLEIPKEDLLQATKCLTGGEETTTQEDGDDLGIDAGDLELLFADHEDDQG